MFLQLIDFLDGEAGCRCNLLNGKVHGLQVASGLLFVLSQLLHRRVSPRCRRVNPRHRRVALGQCRIALRSVPHCARPVPHCARPVPRHAHAPHFQLLRLPPSGG